MDTLTNSFLSNDNKGLIWSILYEQGTFKTIPNQEVQKVKQLFENKILELAQQAPISPSTSLTDLNKKAITEMVQDIKNYKVDKVSDINEVNITAEDISRSKIKRFNSDLEQREEEFKLNGHAPTPTPIDFSDKGDQPIGDENEVNDMLKKMIDNREQSLNQVLVTQDGSTASEWLQSKSTGLSLTIGESMPNIQQTNQEVPKKVTFADIQPRPHTPPQSNIDDETKIMLKVISSKQDRILALLEGGCPPTHWRSSQACRGSVCAGGR